MLNVKLPDNVHKGMRDLIHTLSIGHVSKYPIDVVVRLDSTHHVVTDVYFLDSRFPMEDNDSWDLDHVLGYFWVSSSCTYVLKSNRITNSRYSPHSDGFHCRKTADPKKMLRILKEVIAPYTDLEIARRSDGAWGVARSLESWKDVERSKLYELVTNIGGREIINEVTHLKATGVQFHSKAFQDVANTVEEALRETTRREDFAAKTVNLYVYEQPDGTVSLTYLGSTKGKAYKAAQSWSYQTMHEVPESIQQQIALLKISEINVYIPEVGKRDVQSGYWVHVPDGAVQFKAP